MLFLQKVFLGEDRKRIISKIARKFKVNYKTASQEIQRILVISYAKKQRIPIDEIIEKSLNPVMAKFIIEKLTELKILEKPIDKEFEIAFKDAESIFEEMGLDDNEQKKEYNFAARLDQLFDDLVNMIKEKAEEIPKKEFMRPSIVIDPQGKMLWTITEGIKEKIHQKYLGTFPKIVIIILEGLREHPLDKKMIYENRRLEIQPSGHVWLGHAWLPLSQEEIKDYEVIKI